MNVEHRTSNTEHRTKDAGSPVRQQRAFDLEERLLGYAADILRLCDCIPRSVGGTYVAGQLVRSGVSPLYNHGEAESAESPRDFIHKLKICLKELRESLRALRLIQRSGMVDDEETVRSLISETDQLIRIFVTSIRTARTNMAREPDDTEHYGDPE